MKPLRILHISDLHERAAFEGMPERRKAALELDKEERGYVLGQYLIEKWKPHPGFATTAQRLTTKYLR